MNRAPQVVYLLTFEEPYEAAHVAGVFSTSAGAKAEAEKNISDANWRKASEAEWTDTVSGTATVRPYTLDEPSG